MSSWFNTSTTLRHVTPIPDGITASRAIKLLQSHEFYMECDPHMIKFELIAHPKEAPPPIPADRKATGVGQPKSYKVTDKVSTLPAGLWDSDVVSTYEFINVERGVFARIRSPLSTVMETLWTLEETEQGKLELVEEVLIKCSRILVGTITSMCENNWQKIHATMVNQLKETS